METKSSKRSAVSDTNLWNRYQTDVFFRTTCHIIILQVLLTLVVLVGLWFVMQFLLKDASQTLINTFAQMLQGQSVTAENVNESLKNIRTEQFWPVMIIATAVILSFGFIMVYVSLTPTRRSLERKKRFISNIAHELRTPLAIMRTNTDVALLDKEIQSKIKSMLERNITEFDRISEIMDNLLVLSNLLRDEHVRFENVDLSMVAKRALDTLNETLDHKDITLNLKSHTKQTVLGNASALEQVVFNLVKNAVAHTKNEGTITVDIDLAENDKYVNLSVSDSGSGIARRDLFHIFEPFYRARKSSSSDGQGLGLAIVNEIVQIHRGKIKVQSAVGRGTTFVVSIMRSLPEEASAEPEKTTDMEEVTMDFSHRIFR